MDEAAVMACVHRYRLLLPRVLPRGSDGERLGRGTGSSLEFQDYRAYAPGDDPRHVDWPAYARSDQLMIRLYREEVAPRLELAIDVSASMASTPAKARRARELALLVAELCRADRMPATLWMLGERVERHPREIGRRIRELAPAGAGGLEAALRAPPAFSPNSIRIVLSDFLFPGEPAPLVRAFARGAARLTFIQVLDREEVAPSLQGGKRLLDVETGRSLDLVVTAAAREAYRRRLDGLRGGYRDELRRAGGRFATVTTGGMLEESARGSLREAGVLAARGGGG